MSNTESIDRRGESGVGKALQQRIMRAIELTNTGRLTLVDTRDYEFLATRNWSEGNHGYVRTCYRNPVTGKRSHELMHHFILGTEEEGRFVIPGGLLVDHINGDKLDNRRSNLRIVTQSENQANRHSLDPRCTSGFTGVTWCKVKRKWIAQLTVMYRHIFLGYYATPEEALQARAAGELKHLGCLCPTTAKALGKVAI